MVRATRASAPASVAAMPQRTRHPEQQPADGPISHDIGGKSAHRQKNARISKLAAEQHGVVALWQLFAMGMSERAAQDRADAGFLHRVHQGVYAVGHARVTRRGRLMAAVLACGPEAVLSHRSAIVLWGLRKDGHASIDVTAPNRRGRIPKGISAHRDGALAAEDRTVVHGIPCTTVARTLLDFAAVAPVWELRKAVSEAEVLRILDHDQVRKLIRRSRGRRGVARLRMVMDEIHPKTKWTRSDMEVAFLEMCRRAGLPVPEVNVKLYPDGRKTVPDFLWRDAGLIVEADSREFHDTGSAFEGDREREQRLQLAGWRVSRCTWRQIEREPRRLGETIRGLLSQPARVPVGRKPTHIVGNRPVGAP